MGIVGFSFGMGAPTYLSDDLELTRQEHLLQVIHYGM